ncbi:LAGLIDADG family homing endonuclease [Salinibaculum salinum]|uniref:LAGLIDADG family homing endonuclease n=1 Tax=Salinibaculum salinum TaxID=3131996 RepID=UPI0030EEB082
MARADDTELIDTFEEFYRNYYRNAIGELAQKYPTEQKSLYVDWDDLYRFDPDLADDFRNKPQQLQEYAEEALRLYDLPVDVSLGQAHVRVQNLPESTGIRQIRADHRGSLISVKGIVRKATDVRPKITNAAFECQRCGTLSRIPQTDGDFQEPHECQGCERQGPFRINFDQSEFIDAQKLRIQESPEGLRGGETPQSIDVNIEDDITGEVTAGDHVEVTGILKLEQQGNDREKSAMFDVYMTGLSVTIEDEQFEDMDITDEDKKEIVELSNESGIYEKMVGAIAPSIYGYEKQKLAMILQLFSGVTKHLPDGSRIRGDLHMLLIGDPGTGKCLKGETKVTLGDGRRREIRDIVEENLDDPKPVDDGVYDTVDIPLPSLTDNGSISERQATKVWKREAPDEMHRIRTASGRVVEVTPSHPLFVQSDGEFVPRKATELEEGEFVALPKQVETEPTSSLDVDYRRSKANNAVRLSLPDEWTPWLARLVGYIIAEGYATLKDDNAGTVTVTNEDAEILDDVANALERLGLPYSTTSGREGKSAKAIRCNASEFVSFLKNLEACILEKSASQRVPEPILLADRDTQRAFLRAYIDSEGHVSTKQRSLTVASMSRELLDDVRALLLEVGVHASLEPRQNGSYRLRISGSDFETYVESVGFVTERKATAATAFDDISQNTNTDIIPLDGERLREIRDSLALSQSECGLPRSTYQHYERGDRNPSRSSLSTVTETFEERVEWLHRQRALLSDGDWDRIETLRAELGISQRVLADGMGISQTAISYYEREGVAPDGGRTENAKWVVLNRINDALSVSEDVQRLRMLVESDVQWDCIDSIQSVSPDYDWVYDLEVAGTHNYISNGVISHNSAMLQYIRQIAPRSVYTSGKGASSAGLTAAAVRDDFGDGQQWTLEAGALVLADKGIAAVDELDKMECVTGETLVHTGDGIVPIRELTLDADPDGDVEYHEKGRSLRDVDATVWTMTDDGQLTTRDVTAVHEYDAPSALREVTLESGESVTATADHPFFVLDEGRRTETPAAGLEPGDWVYVPDSIPTPASDGGAVVSSADAVESSVSQNPPALGALMGYIAGDGNVYYNREEGSYGMRFTNAEEELLADFERACREVFDATPVRHPSEQRPDGVETVRLHGKAYVDELLAAGLNLETYEGKRVPAAVLQGDDGVKAAFIRALADAEGNVDDRKVTIFSASYELLLGAKMLLSEFDVTSQIQQRERDEGRDLYVLAITAADSLSAFNRHVGFTLNRKQDALDTVCENAAGDRTILDVLPECGDLFVQARDSLRLHQEECGLKDATYCNFENGDANFSMQKADRVLEQFEVRREQAVADRTTLCNPCSWETLATLKDRYHVAQHELADGTSYSQQQVSMGWGSDETLRTTVRQALRDVVSTVAETDFSTLRDLVRGDVKWRRVATVESADPSVDDGCIEVLRQRLADLLGTGEVDIESRATDLLADEPSADSWRSLRSELDRHGIPLQRIADHMGVAGSTVSRWFNGVVDGESFGTVREIALNRIESKRRRIRTLLSEIEERRNPKVYDLTVDGTHNFLANGMVVHNSDDRSAMHEALEQQSISVSKAGINATLKSRCSLLGAANPKYGRFDQYEPIGEQINLEPALISRFDLIFTVTDQPDEEEDANLAEHIIQTNYAGELHTHRTETSASNYTAEEVETVTEEVEPTIDPDLLRKYIAYAKRNCFPTMTEEAKGEIQDFYVNLRSRGSDEDAAVPVTARKLEALVRLAEASARIRLSDTVEAEDASRAVDIVRYCLEDIGMDPETGELDADMVETGTSKSQRDRIKDLLSLIQNIEDEYDEGAPVDVILERAEEAGMESSKAEHEIDQLKQKGEVYEPQTDHLRTT